MDRGTDGGGRGRCLDDDDNDADAADAADEAGLLPSLAARAADAALVPPIAAACDCSDGRRRPGIERSRRDRGP